MPNPSNVLVSRANWDLATLYLSSWLQPVVDYASKLGFNVTDLYAAEDTLANFKNALNLTDPATVIIGSHGSESVITAQNNEVLMEACINDDLMKLRTANLVACATGVSLGPSMVKKGANAFLGFQADYVFLIKSGYETRPLDDPYATPFFDSANAVAYALLDGKTLKEVYEAGVNRFNYWISQWWNVPDPSASEIIQWLEWDKSNFIVIAESGIYERQPLQLVLTLPKLPILLFAGMIFLGLVGKS